MTPPKKTIRPVMFAGTASDVGKSILSAAFCRILRQDGYRPVPFKAQNLALNSFPASDGGEIGRAQAVQAEAAGIPPLTAMNPLLLKPSGEGVQVILNGKTAGVPDRSGADYIGRNREAIRAEIGRAFRRLEKSYSPVVIEGAGSIAELNLKNDLANLSVARMAEANIFLVGDIERGGIFASLYGTLSLLTPEDRRRVRGLIVNKFRGADGSFAEGRRILEERCGIPVLGVIPHFDHIAVDPEDSVGLGNRRRGAETGRIRVAVLLLPHISNHTDFSRLERDERVRLFYTDSPGELSSADVVILPGTKNTPADLRALRRNGLAGAVLRAYRDGKTVLGICGGYQMMGRWICGSDEVGGGGARIPGLGLLPVTTTLTDRKIVRESRFLFLQDPTPCRGYEIHLGNTVVCDGAPESPLARTVEGRTDGYYLNERCMGTYLHGILDNPSIVDFLLAPYAAHGVNGDLTDTDAWRERQYDLLADHVRTHTDMTAFYQILHT